MKRIKDDVDVVPYFTNQYTVVTSLHIQKCGYTVCTVNNNNGLSVTDIKTNLLKWCQNTLPVNILTNNVVLRAILKFVFSYCIPTTEWNNIPLKCYENKKERPKVIIWSVMNEIYNHKLLNLSEIEEFMKKFPKRTTNLLLYRKKHSYISYKPMNVFSHCIECTCPLLEQSTPHQPISFILKKYGSLDCCNQEIVEPVIKIMLPTNFKRNKGIKDALVYLEKKKIIDTLTEPNI